MTSFQFFGDTSNEEISVLSNEQIEELGNVLQMNRLCCR